MTKKVAKEILPLIVEDLIKADCEIRGDKNSLAIDSRIKEAGEDDFYKEFLDKIISVRIVKDIDEAIEKINNYSSSHTETIVTEDKKRRLKIFSLASILQL